MNVIFWYFVIVVKVLRKWKEGVTNASFAHQDFTNLSKRSRHKEEEEATSILQD